MALDELYLCAHQREAWTDIGDFGVVRRAGLRQIDNFSQSVEVNNRLYTAVASLRRTPHCAQKRERRQSTRNDHTP